MLALLRLKGHTVSQIQEGWHVSSSEICLIVQCTVYSSCIENEKRRVVGIDLNLNGCALSCLNISLM